MRNLIHASFRSSLQVHDPDHTHSLRVYDSTKGAIPADVKIQVAAIMRCQEAELVIEVTDIDLQIDGDDCGLHAIATVYELCAVNDPTGITWQHNQLRSHLHACLEKLMNTFPKKSQRPSGIVRASLSSVSAVCYKND